MAVDEQSAAVTSKKRGSRWTSVVLPDPLEPTIATTSPGATVRLMSCSTSRSSSACGVAEVHVLEADALVERRQLDRALFLPHFVLRIEELEYLLDDAPSACWKLLLNCANLRTGSYSLNTAMMNAMNKPSLKIAVLDVLAPEQDEQRDRDRSEDVHHRRIDGKRAD